MTFEEVVDQAIAMLQRRGRVTYRLLKRQFSLDDEALADLKEELIYGQRLAVDEEERVLVWTGGAGAPPEPAPQPRPQEDQPTDVELPPRRRFSPEAERRQLTVMFCDLVGSTPLSEQLDPEDLRDVVRAYQQTCAEVVQRFEGHIAQLLGDALLIYFGWPQAHEDDAQRAVRTGLGMLDAMGTLNTCLEQEKGIRLAIRVGIHTGLVVVGEMGSGGHQEQLALGEVPNIASRLQGLAAPNTVVISEATSRLIAGYFTVEDLGLHILKGVAEPQQVYHVIGESATQSRLAIASTRGLTPLVGREQEVGLLYERWHQVKEGQGHVVLLSGEGGIGKSRLVQVLKAHLADEPYTRWECRSSSYYQNTALYPLTDLFQRTLPWHPEDASDAKLATLEQTLSQYRLPLEDAVPLFAPLLALPVPEDRYPPLPLSPQRQRQKLLEAIVSILLEHAAQQPLLFVLEDLHWTDPSTLELLTLLIDQAPTASVLVVLTCRPAFQPPWHHRSYLTEVTLTRLSRRQIEQMAEAVGGGKRLPAEVLHQIVEKTDGVPLFVEEMTKAVLESGQLKAGDGHYELTGSLASFAIPATLHDSLMARLDRLVTAKAVAQYAAVIGRQFSYALLQAVSQLDAATLHRELGRLVEAELVYQRGVPPHAIYTFKHALVQDVAYQSLLKSTRQQYHQRIATVLESPCPENAAPQPELLAYHFTEAGLHEHAIGYWQQAGQRALQRSANQEAISHLTTGLDLLPTLPDTRERLQQELEMRMILGPALMAIKGMAAPEVEQTYGRARALCGQVGEPFQLVPTLYGLCRFYYVRGALQTARELGEQLLSLAQHQRHPTSLLLAHQALGTTLYFLGALVPAREHLAQGVALTVPEEQRALAIRYNIAPGIQCLAYLAHVLWRLGYPDQALRRAQEACTLAQELAHPHNTAFALYHSAVLHRSRGELHVVQEQVEALMTLATEHGFTLWMAAGVMLQGWVLVAQGQDDQGVVQIRQGLDAWLATGAGGVNLAHRLALLAEACGYVGQLEEGLTVIAEALAQADTTGEHYWVAELHRLKGELLLQQVVPDETQAEACFQQALVIARSQQAKSLDLRAATSLARLWQAQGKPKEAYDLLAPVYGWFTEGFDTADLQEAKALLMSWQNNQASIEVGDDFS